MLDTIEAASMSLWAVREASDWICKALKYLNHLGGISVPVLQLDSQQECIIQII